MNSQERTNYLTREGVMKLLSDDEVASVSQAESTDRLAEGDEYLDLQRLDQGVLRVASESADMGRVLPRKAVREATWLKLVAVVSAEPERASPSTRGDGFAPVVLDEPN
jgi:hypothetical protein